MKLALLCSGALGALLLLAACGEPSEAPPASEPAEAAETEAPESAEEAPEPEETEPEETAETEGPVFGERRPDSDTALDEVRYPEAVLQFAGVEEGQTIVELEAGGGYFTEVMSRAIGPEGTIYMQNPEAFDTFLGSTVTDRVDGRLTNVEIIKSDFDELPVGDGVADIVTWFQGPHELWYEPEGRSLGEPSASFGEIMRVLKPGGHFIVIDHTASGGTPPESGGDTHRIDPLIVRDLATEAGFDFVEESDLYDNPDDDLTLNVFDAAIRRNTDQFLMKFAKPD